MIRSCKAGTALGLSQFTVGANNIDAPAIVFDNKRRVDRYVVGFTGTFDAGDTERSWESRTL